MNTISNNINDFLDDDINNALERLGFIFPKSITDFIEIEHESNKKKCKQPERLKDPFKFLNQKSYNNNISLNKINEDKDYSQNLAQAAREGKEISDDIKKKMLEDKLRSKQQNKNNT